MKDMMRVMLTLGSLSLQIMAVVALSEENYARSTTLLVFAILCQIQIQTQKPRF